MPVIEKNGKKFVVQEQNRTPEQIAERMRMFNHHDAADLIEELLDFKWMYEQLDK